MRAVVMRAVMVRAVVVRAVVVRTVVVTAVWQKSLRHTCHPQALTSGLRLLKAASGTYERPQAYGYSLRHSQAASGILGGLRHLCLPEVYFFASGIKFFLAKN